MKWKKVKWKKISAALFLAVWFGGCRMELAAEDRNGIFPAQIQSEAQRADTIKEELCKIKGVAGSAVVVEGHTVIIGLRIADMGQKEAKALLEAVQQAAKNAEADIQNVSVTTKDSIVALIEKEEKKRGREGETEK